MKNNLVKSINRFGFSLVEMLAAVSIIGVISFLAIPNLVRMRSDSEKNLAISRCESLNMAMATYTQVRGRFQASQDWQGASTDQAKYTLLKPYIAFPETNLTDYVPSGYRGTFQTIDPLVKIKLEQQISTTWSQIYY